MKTKNIIICFIASLMLSITACSDFLDQVPDDLMTLDMVFEDEQRVQEWMAGVYGYLPDPYWDWGRRMGFNPLSDEVQIPLNWSSFGWWVADVQQGNWGATKEDTYDIWGDTYKAVRQAHIFIENVKPLPAKGISEARVEEMKLECRFVVAFLYCQMLELYGPFPLVTELLDRDAPIESLQLSRTSISEIVSWLDKELLEIADGLPVELENTTSEFGRPTKGAALACRARMLLIAASPLFNGSQYYRDVKNKDGVNLFPTTVDNNKWKEAADATKLLLDLNVYSLYTETYGNSGNIDPFYSFENLFLKTGEGNNEIIFARPTAHDTWEYDKHCQPRGTGGNGAYGVTQELVDAFFTKNGLPIDKDTEYSESGFSSSRIKYPNTSWNQGSSLSGYITDAGTYNMYVNREPRFYVTVKFNDQYMRNDGGRKTDFYYNGKDGLPSYDSPPCGYLLKKRIHSDSKPQENYTPYRAGIIFRLGEFYLNYVEALNEYNPSHPDILIYLNKIRERAGIPLYGNEDGQVPVPSSQDEMRKAIHQERQVELATEGKRYADIRRWMTAKEIFSKPITGMNVNGDNADSFYRRKTFMNRIFSNKMYLWPIYQKYIDNNPNLVQNKGW